MSNKITITAEAVPETSGELQQKVEKAELEIENTAELLPNEEDESEVMTARKGRNALLKKEILGNTSTGNSKEYFYNSKDQTIKMDEKIDGTIYSHEYTYDQ